MMLALGTVWVVTLLELFIYLLPASQARRWLAAVMVIVVASSLLWLVAIDQELTAILIAGIGVYRIINLLRIVRMRMNAAYLKHMAVQSEIWIVSVQATVTGLWLLQNVAPVSSDQLWVIAAWIQVVAAASLCISTVRHLRAIRPPRLVDSPDEKSLPTLTVAIPARNETDDLEACLESLIASDYPKLEILVLDDCSQNKRTPEIIRSYAHDGVRFLQGEVPKLGWLAKNQAYQQLYEAANGELILYCGVDVRFAPSSLRLLVVAMQQKHKTMLSIIPRNIVPKLSALRATVLVQTMRYAWEIALPRRQFNRPPVLSTCWLIRRNVLAANSGFTGVDHSITPESHFAKVSLKQDGYSFMQASPEMAITSNKSLYEQHSTAIRMQYPKLHRRLELVLLLTAAEYVVAVLPYILVIGTITGFVSRELLIPSLLSVVLLTIAYASIVHVTYRRWLLRSLVALPIAALLDIILLQESMIRYEFFEVIWKERNVCLPVMHAVEQMPQPGVQ